MEKRFPPELFADEEDRLRLMSTLLYGGEDHVPAPIGEDCRVSGEWSLEQRAEQYLLADKE